MRNRSPKGWRRLKNQALLLELDYRTLVGVRLRFWLMVSRSRIFRAFSQIYEKVPSGMFLVSLFSICWLLASFS
ncbi:hypothetical protein Goari_014427, partial [Gossypium aridum]|nr:hypothetical protein [Gossypium aridum]